MNKPAAPKLASNLSLARKHLARFHSAPALHLIAGKPVPSHSGETFDSLDPTSNETFVLIRKDVYEHMKALLADEEAVRKTQEAFLNAFHRAAISTTKDSL